MDDVLQDVNTLIVLIRAMSIIGHITRPSIAVGRYQMLKHFDMESSANIER